jgi:Zn-dependent peptidase ImmA (M78 family)
MKVSPDRVGDWEQTGRLRKAQAERLAAVTHTPVGLLYADEPPEDRLPLPDFRRIAGVAPPPSPNLLDIVDDAQRRQDWFREYLVSSGAEPLDFVGSLNLQVPVARAASRISERHGLTLEQRSTAKTWEDALRLQVEQIEDAGILVMRSGIVGSNTRRRLEVSEFRGFAIADPFAPLIFLNARDAKAAQMFTLMHELAHIWMGQSGVSNLERTMPTEDRVERYCSEVAAEVLVPLEVLRERAWPQARASADPVRYLTRQFKVSSLVVLRRLFDLGELDWETYRERYEAEEDRFRGQEERREPGGDYYRTQRTRSSVRFATALVESTLEGRTTWREAAHLLGIKKAETFARVARNLGFAV